VATDERSPRDGKYLEGLGWYDPKKKEKNFLLKLERIELWLKNGAKISPIVQTLVNKARRGITSSTSKKPRKKGGAKAAPAAQAQEPKKADEPKKEAPAAPAADVKK